MRTTPETTSLASLLTDFHSDPEFAAAWAIEQPKVNLAANTIRLRRARNMTQADLARAVGVRQPRIAEIERGDANPQLETVARLAHALGVSADELLTDPCAVRAHTAPKATVRKTFKAVAVVSCDEWPEDAKATYQKHVERATVAYDLFAMVA